MFRRLFILAALLLFSSLSTAAAQTCANGVACETDPHVMAIAAYNAPIEQLMTRRDVLYNYDYRQVVGPLDVRQSPNGPVVENRPAYDLWVSVDEVVDGWARINEGQWIPYSQLRDAPVSRLSGVLLHRTPDYPLAWVLETTTPSAAPGEAPAVETTALNRYALVNVFAQTVGDGVEWVQIGIDQWVEAARLAVARPTMRPAEVDTARWVGVDLAEQVLIAYEGEQAVFAALISSGMDELPTHPGLFRVFHRTYAQTLSWGVPGEPFSYTVEDVPHILFFNGDQGLHAAYWHDAFGTNRSHGCVNLSLTDAEWVFRFLSAEIDFNTPGDLWPMVYIYSA